MVLHLVLVITPVVVYLLTLFIKNFIKYLLSKQKFPGIDRQLIEEKWKLEILDKKPKKQPDPNLLLPVHRLSTDETDVHFHKLGQDSIFNCRMLWLNHTVIRVKNYKNKKTKQKTELCELLIKKSSLASFSANQFQK